MRKDKAASKVREYAAAALAYEDAKAAAAKAQELEQSLCGAPDGIKFPVSITMPDGRVVTVDTWNEPDNYCMNYSISEALR